MSQIDPISVLNFGPIVLLFAPFPLYPFHASQAGPQKTSQICVLLLQVASLGDFYGVSKPPSPTKPAHIGIKLAI